LEENMFEWHFTIRGPTDTPFEGGTYHGRILLPSEYPFKPPNIVFLTVSSDCRVGLLRSGLIHLLANHLEKWTV
jgi:ubiquitin-conjugating enzyme E2 J1